MLRDPTPQAYLDGFGDGASKTVQIYRVELDGAEGPRRQDRDSHHDIHIRLAATDIETSFPQRDIRVTLDAPLPTPPRA